MTLPNKILLVEDDAFTRFMMKEIFDTLGLDAEVVGNGLESIEKINEHPEDYALILMDLHMPIMSGVEATEGIRAAAQHPPRDIPIVAMTADVSYHDDAVVKNLGMDGFAAKPLSPGQLMDIVSSYCQAPKNH